MVLHKNLSFTLLGVEDLLMNPIWQLTVHHDDEDDSYHVLGGIKPPYVPVVGRTGPIVW